MDVKNDALRYMEDKRQEELNTIQKNLDRAYAQNNTESDLRVVDESIGKLGEAFAKLVTDAAKRNEDTALTTISISEFAQVISHTVASGDMVKTTLMLNLLDQVREKLEETK